MGRYSETTSGRQIQKETCGRFGKSASPNRQA